MFAKKFELFSMLGFRVSLDLTWFVLAILIVWSLAEGYFPAVIDGLDANAAYMLGVGGALGLFLSIVFHEFSHAIVARQFDIPIGGITLFIFGGVAEMEREPPNPVSEFLMAAAGPVASYVLAGLFQAVATALPVATAAAPWAALFAYLALINMVLATFNLVPAFPLDGGRIFRAAIWWWTGDLARATRIGAFMGRVFGSFLIALGVLSVISGNFVAGMWQGLIGLFIIGASRSSEMQTTLTAVLGHVPVRRIMVPDPVTVPAGLPVDDIIERYFYRLNHKVFPVVRDGVLVGCLGLNDVSRIAPQDRLRLTAGDIVPEGSAARTVAPDMSLLEALTAMRNLDTSRVMVVQNGVLRGMLTMRDIMSYFTIHRELEEGAPPGSRR